MKKLFISIYLFSFLAYGQNNDSLNCDNWIESKTDKMTGKVTTAAKKTLIVSSDDGKTGIGITMIESARNEIIMLIQAVGASSCINEGENINILFTNGSRLELKNNISFNCKGESTIYFGGLFGKKKEIKELMEKKIQTMRVWTSDGYVERDFSIDNQNEFKNVLNCLMK
jgi:hypothetical protein